jgi:RNA polymerase sigma-70 factor (ECF subfamily)
LSGADQLDAWVVATAPRAVAYAASLLGSRASAEDVVQECYYRLIKAGRYDLPRDGVKLLFRAITNRCISLTGRRGPIQSTDVGEGFSDPPAPAAEQPDSVAMNRELEDAIGTGLVGLPVQQRAALELRILGHSQQEIAEMLAVTVSHAGVLIHRARQALSAYLVPYIGEERA